MKYGIGAAKSMDRKSFLLQMDELLELPERTLTGAERMEALENWNSMAMVSFIAMVDEHFEFTVSPRSLRKCETVDQLLALIEPLNKTS